MRFPTTKQEIREFLDKLADAELIDFYILQTKMPGLRWSVYLKGQPGRVMTTRQIQHWIDGFVVGTAAERRIWNHNIEEDRRQEAQLRERGFVSPPEEPYRYATGDPRD